MPSVKKEKCRGIQAFSSVTAASMSASKRHFKSIFFQSRTQACQRSSRKKWLILIKRIVLSLAVLAIILVAAIVKSEWSCQHKEVQFKVLTSRLNFRSCLIRNYLRIRNVDDNQVGTSRIVIWFSSFSSGMENEGNQAKSLSLCLGDYLPLFPFLDLS